jgi:hypothetical protein
MLICTLSQAKLASGPEVTSFRGLLGSACFSFFMNGFLGGWKFLSDVVFIRCLVGYNCQFWLPVHCL